MPKDLFQRYEDQLQKAIHQAQHRILRIYEQSIVEISLRASTVTLKDRPFSLSLYPAINSKIERTVDSMHKGIYRQIVSSVKESWQLSNSKNNIIVDRRLAGRKTKAGVRQILYDPNKEALNAFLNRREKGLNLSDRIWKTLDPFKSEMEQALGLELGKGKSAPSMAREIMKYLNDPDRLYRRVKSEEGKMVLSKKAREYKPGRGVYRSSYKNALRVARTETNMAYRSADHERWKNMPFVTGIEVRLSDAHPKYDICDTLKGKYPKDFKFTGWHPQCLCYQVPLLMSDEEYGKFEDQILGIADFEPNPKKIVSKPPASFTKYLYDNRDRIKGWSNKPYWLKENKKYVNSK